MKKFLLTVLSLCTMCVAANAQVAKNIASQYHGELYISLMEPINDETEAMYCQTIELAANGDDKVDFSLHNFSFAEMNLGDITIPEIGVSTNGTKTLFGEKAPLPLVLGDGLIEATAQVNPATSYVSADSIVVNLDIMWTNTGDEPCPIYVRFTGTKCRPLDATLVNGLIDNYDLAIGGYDGNGDYFETYGAMTIGKSQTGDGVDWTWENFTLNDVNYGNLKFENLHFINRRMLNEDNLWEDDYMVSEDVVTSVTVDGKTLEAEMYGDECLAFEYTVDGEKYDIINFYVYASDDNWNTYWEFGVSAWKNGASILSVEKVENNVSAKDSKVYTLDGRYVGNSLKGNLGRGIYIMNGKKVFKK